MTKREQIIALANECGMNASPAPGDKAALGRSVPLPWLETFFHAAQKLERASHKPQCNECTAWVKAEADNKEWIEGVARGKEIIAKLAAKDKP